MNREVKAASGLILVDKPEGISSFQVIRELRKKLGIKKAGHAGTLDPFATGLLVCAMGNATKTLTYLQSGGKIYTGTVALGIRSSTDDITGKCVHSPVPESLTIDEVSRIAKQFEGQIMQVPPAVSALHVDGERAYDLVRRGEEVNLPPRQVHVEQFRVFDLLRCDDGTAAFSFEIRCSKGTYIRALARDLGTAIGVGGCLRTLRRTFSAPFGIAAASRLEDVSAANVLPWYAGFGGAQPVEVSDRERARLGHGCQQTLGDIIGRISRESSALPPDGFLLGGAGAGGPCGLIREEKGELELALFFPEP